MENVRMGDLVVSSRAGDELVAIGLGSCIGLALVDRQSGVAGLAHVVLPESTGVDGPPGKFADTAVPELLRQLEKAGAVKRRLQAVMIGGARMFALGASLDIGSRNSAAVKENLAKAGLRLYAEETGGNRGRTARVILGVEVSSQLAGGERTSLLTLGRPKRDDPVLGTPRLAGARR
jgi:chemotaxis protein CheD